MLAHLLNRKAAGRMIGWLWLALHWLCHSLLCLLGHSNSFYTPTIESSVMKSGIPVTCLVWQDGYEDNHVYPENFVVCVGKVGY